MPFPGKRKPKEIGSCKLRPFLVGCALEAEARTRFLRKRIPVNPLVSHHQRTHLLLCQKEPSPTPEQCLFTRRWDPNADLTFGFPVHSKTQARNIPTGDFAPRVVTAYPVLVEEHEVTVAEMGVREKAGVPELIIEGTNSTSI